MSLILREREEKRKSDRRDQKLAMIKDEARRYGVAMKDPEKSEKEFIYKIKAIHSFFSEDVEACAFASKVSSSIRGQDSPSSYPVKLPMIEVDPKAILDLL